MANKLTGSYDAVALISRRQLNGLLASLHQNGASDQPPLRLGHNGVLRVGDPKPTKPELVRLRFRNWIRNLQLAGAPLNVIATSETGAPASKAIRRGPLLRWRRVADA